MTVADATGRSTERPYVRPSIRIEFGGYWFALAKLELYFIRLLRRRKLGMVGVTPGSLLLRSRVTRGYSLGLLTETFPTLIIYPYS